MSNEKTSSSGISVLGLLGVAFVVLKLVNVINWSWWWVTMPFWFGLVIFLIVLIIWGLVQLNKNEKEFKHYNENKKPRSKFAERLEEAKRNQINN